jgi:hypothetical protein
MPSHPVPLPAQADIAAVVNETGLSHELVARLREHLTGIHEKPPDREDLGLYAAYGAEHLGEGGLRLYLEMPADPDRPATPAARWLVEQMAAEDQAWSKRRPGTWFDGKFWVAYLDACKRATPPFTSRSVAPHFDTIAGKRGISPDYLRRLIRRFGVLAKVDGRIRVVYE